MKVHKVHKNLIYKRKSSRMILLRFLLYSGGKKCIHVDMRLKTADKWSETADK